MAAHATARTGLWLRWLVRKVAALLLLRLLLLHEHTLLVIEPRRHTRRCALAPATLRHLIPMHLLLLLWLGRRVP